MDLDRSQSSRWALRLDGQRVAQSFSAASRHGNRSVPLNNGGSAGRLVPWAGNNQDYGGRDRHASGHDRLANETRVPLHENVIRHDPLNESVRRLTEEMCSRASQTVAQDLCLQTEKRIPPKLKAHNRSTYDHGTGVSSPCSNCSTSFRALP